MPTFPVEPAWQDCIQDQRSGHESGGDIGVAERSCSPEIDIVGPEDQANSAMPSHSVCDFEVAANTKGRRAGGG